MQITESLIEKFFNDRCTGEEAAFVARYFKRHPEAWKRYMIDNWNGDTGKDGNTGNPDAVPENYKELMLEQILKATVGTRAVGDGQAPVRIMWRWVAAAASVLVVFAGIWMFNSVSQQKEIAAAPVGSGKEVTKAPGDDESWQTNSNRTDQKLKMKLEDGSVVTLFPHSSIRYGKHFPGNKRDLYLEGQAYFQTAKDHTRPFTVYAGNMATTVLGTSFSVNENGTGVTVKLYSGKVMIRPAGNILKGWKKDIFLLPGEEMKYESGHTQAEVASFRDEIPAEKHEVAKGGIDDEDMVFDNAALPDVMNKLSKHYRAHIDFRKAELTNMYFSGAVLKTDSLSVILKVIANMNDLAITQTTDGFRVRPSKK